MLNPNLVALIAVEATERNNHQYVVVLDSAKWGTADAENPAFGTVILTTNNKKKAMEVTDFWDNLTNTHLVPVDAFTREQAKVFIDKKDALKELMENSLDVPLTNGYFNTLTAREKLELRVEAALARIS